MRPICWRALRQARGSANFFSLWEKRIGSGRQYRNAGTGEVKRPGGLADDRPLRYHPQHVVILSGAKDLTDYSTRSLFRTSLDACEILRDAQDDKRGRMQLLA